MVRASSAAFAGLLALLGAQRLLELRLSKRNASRLLAAGGVEHGAAHFPLMAALHTSWFAAIIIETFALRRRFNRARAAVALAVAAAGQALRYSAIRTLGWRWNVRVITLPGVPPVREGIYRYLRHPNYVGVVLELAAVPLVHGAYLTSLSYTVANLLLLRHRLRVEEAALQSG